MHAGSDPDVFRPMFVNGVAVFNVDLVPRSLIILVLPNGNEIALPTQLFLGLGLVEFSYGTGLSEGTPALPGGLAPVTFVRFQDLPG